MYNKNYIGIDKRVCVNCGKEIYFLDFTRWAYALRNSHATKYFCSYKCKREGEEIARIEGIKKRKEYREKLRMRKAMQG